MLSLLIMFVKMVGSFVGAWGSWAAGSRLDDSRSPGTLMFRSPQLPHLLTTLPSHFLSHLPLLLILTYTRRCLEPCSTLTVDLPHPPKFVRWKLIATHTPDASLPIVIPTSLPTIAVSRQPRWLPFSCDIPWKIIEEIATVQAVALTRLQHCKKQQPNPHPILWNIRAVISILVEERDKRKGRNDK